MTRHEKILKLLSDGEWHHSNEICSPWIGGRQGGARISELRKQGEKIESKKGEGGNLYRLVPKGQGVLLKVRPHI